MVIPEDVKKYLQVTYQTKDYNLECIKIFYSSTAEKKKKGKQNQQTRILKCAKDQKRYFLKEYGNDQQVHENVLNITNNYGNANQDHNEMPPHTPKQTEEFTGPRAGEEKDAKKASGDRKRMPQKTHQSTGWIAPAWK